MPTSGGRPCARGGPPHRRPADSSGQPLSFLRSQRRAGFRPRSRRAACGLNIPAGTSVRFEPGEEKEVAAGGIRRRTRQCLGHKGKGNANEPLDSAPHLRRSLWTDHGRPRAAGRYRTDRRSREGLHRLRRRDHVRRRQSHSRRHGPELHAPRASRAARSIWSSPTR